MCGICGYIGKDGKTVDRAALKEMARYTSRRGNDAYGMAWINKGETEVNIYKAAGSMGRNLKDLKRVKNATVVVVHTRAATHGRVKVMENNHPHPSGAGAIVHNGVVRNYDKLKRGLNLVSECDSEVYARIIEAEKGPKLERFVTALEAGHGVNSLVGIWPRPNRVFLGRINDQDMAITETEGGIYFASEGECLPADYDYLKNNTVLKLTQKKNGKLGVAVRTVEHPSTGRSTLTWQSYCGSSRDRTLAALEAASAAQEWPSQDVCPRCNSSMSGNYCSWCGMEWDANAFEEDLEGVWMTESKR